MLVQVPEEPTAWPRLLMPCTKPSGSPASVGSDRTSPFSQNAGDIIFPGLLAGHPESGTVVSEMPTICPRLLIALACPLFPPSVGRAIMWPSRQRNGRHVRFVPKPQKSSPSGSGTDVSDKPTASPRSLIPP